MFAKRAFFIKLFFVFCFFTQTMRAFVSDSLIKFTQLTFKSDIEKQAFRDYTLNSKVAEVTHLFLTPYSKESGSNISKINERINIFINELQKTIIGQSEQKKVKTIFKEVHKRFLKLYKLENSFSDIFEKGEYNCVSGSAIYAIIFQKMGIPYQIIEAPQHVFLVAYPGTHKIFIETTIPDKGYYTFTDTYVQRFINYMVNAKLISKEEFDNTNISKLFNKYYYDQNGMSVTNLAGIQYANYAIYYVEKNDYENALPEIEKAYYLFPSERNKYLLRTILEHLVFNRNYKELKTVTYLTGLCAFNNINQNEISNEKIEYEFTRILKDQLIEEGNYERFDQSYELLKQGLNDTILKNKIGFVYHYELARLGFIQFKDKKYQMHHLRGAYRLNNKDIDLQNLILAYYAKLAEISKDPVLIIKTSDQFAEAFDFLKEHAAYNSVLANCFLELTYQHYTLNEYAKGDKLLIQFESLCDSDKDISPGEHFVEKAYSTVAAYYYKKGNVNKTRQILKKGIEYAPNNFGLKIRLNQLH